MLPEREDFPTIQIPQEIQMMIFETFSGGSIEVGKRPYTSFAYSYKLPYQAYYADANVYTFPPMAEVDDVQDSSKTQNALRIVFYRRGFTEEEIQAGIVYVAANLKHTPTNLVYHSSFTAGLRADGTVKAAGVIDNKLHQINPTLLEAWILKEGLRALMHINEKDTMFSYDPIVLSKYSRLQEGFNSFFRKNYAPY